MLRLTLATRLALVVFVTLIAVRLILLVGNYAGTDPSWSEVSPDPADLAAIVPILEALDPAARRALVGAVSRHDMVLTLTADPDAGDAADAPARESDALKAIYAQALPGRVIVVEHFRRRFFGNLPYFGRRSRLARVEIPLKTGETLIADGGRANLSTQFGIPTGLVGGLVGTLLALLALFLMHRELRPLVRIAAAADRIGLSSEPQSIAAPRRAAPEIHALVAAFNRLQQRLVTLSRARMAMIGGISHDVRTFATRLRLRLEQLEGPEKANAVRDIEDMVAMLDDALMASRAGAGELSLELLDLVDLVAGEVDDRRSLGAPVTFAQRPAPETALVVADRLALRRVLANLVDNALAYGRSARVAVEVVGATVALIVDDEGRGIPAETRALLMEPFVRGEASRSRSTGGAGLGLSIVHALVSAHDGTIEIEDARGGGARFRVVLARFDARAGEPARKQP